MSYDTAQETCGGSGSGTGTTTVKCIDVSEWQGEIDRSKVKSSDLQLAKAKPKKTIDELAKEVIRGLCGNGSERKRRLTEAGYDCEAVHKRENELLK